MSSQIAKEIFKVKRVIALVYDPIREYAYRELGIETLSTTTLGAKIIKNTLLNQYPNIKEIEEILKIEEEE
jgi:trk system potassium uptake protein TrkA